MCFANLPGLVDLWSETIGDPRVRIAVLDGPVDRTHPCFAGATIEQQVGNHYPFDESTCSLSHGTEVASIVFGQPRTSSQGIAPKCRGLSFPIFGCSPHAAVTTQSQVARAINLARDHGSHVICISAGQLATREFANPQLANAVEQCFAAGIVVVAAAGNDGCDCLHLPAAIPNVLPVGAMDLDGMPLPSSNWGAAYRVTGLLAPGENVPVATTGGQLALRTGTSYAAAIVAAIIGLLLSRELRRGRQPRPIVIRDALLATAIPCDNPDTDDCRRYLAGRVNIQDAISYLDRWSSMMTNDVNLESATTDLIGPQHDAGFFATDEGQRLATDLRAGASIEGDRVGRTASMSPQAVQPSACACQGERRLVYALGQLGHDFATEAAIDAFKQQMRSVSEDRCTPQDPLHLLEFLDATQEKEPWHASSVLWTLNLSGVPRYVIRPEGPYARECFERLPKFYNEQVRNKVQRVAVPGIITGQTTLLNGRTVPVINPDLRGLCNWTTEALIAAVMNAQPKPESADGICDELKCLLDRIYHEMHNSGLTPQERALNYAGTNLFECRGILANLDSRRTLDTIRVEPSQVFRPGSDCWDVMLSFFNPDEPLQTVRKVYRYTVDVSDVIPVTVGEVRSWAAAAS